MSIIHVLGADKQLHEASGVETLVFSAGEPHVNIPDPSHVRGKHFVVEIRGGSFDAIGAALVANDALRRSDAATISLFAPYLPAARQDRPLPFTAKVVADIINSAGFDHVIAVDPHSQVMPSLLDRLHVIDPADVFPKTLAATNDGSEVVVICPDAGAAKRAEAVATRYGLDVAYAGKRRNPHTGKLSDFHCDHIPTTATGVVVDDICDGGRTFIGLAEALGHPRARMRLWTTHGIYANGLEQLEQHFGVIAATDSYPSHSTPHLVENVTPHMVRVLATLLNDTIVSTENRK